MDTNEQTYRSYAAKLGTTQVSNTAITPKIFDAFSGQTLPIHVRTGANSCGSPTELKRYRAVEFHGPYHEGTLRVRIWIDNRYVCDGQVVMSEQPSRRRRLNIPVRRCVGYTIDVEFAGEECPRGIEVHFDAFEGEAQ